MAQVILHPEVEVLRRQHQHAGRRDPQECAERLPWPDGAPLVLPVAVVPTDGASVEKSLGGDHPQPLVAEALPKPPHALLNAERAEDRRDAARAYIEEVGGTLHGFWYGFGKYDGYAIFEAPDNVSLAGVVLAITAGGALASVETTVLMTVEEMLEALAKGKDIGYRRPGE